MSNGNVNSFLDCPSENDLLGFYRASLDGVQMDAIQDHLESCNSCILFFDSQDERSDTIVQALTAQSVSTDDEIEFQHLQARLLSAPEELETEFWPDDELTPPRRDRHPQDRIGEHIGEYELTELIGCGANGAVYKSRHKKLDRFFAVKVLDPRQISDPDSVDRFLIEMKAVGRLDHPHIVRATDAGNVNGQYFLAMEYIDGVDVSRWIRVHGPLSTSNAAEMIRQAATGFEFAHQNGMIHRDIKPSNLFFDQNGNVRILDLGLVSLSESPDADAPNILARGTADYMSPEQWDNYRMVDERADIYSLGCTFFKLLTGEAPFSNTPTGYSGKMQAHQFAPVPALRNFRADVPLGLERLMRKMMSKKQEARPASMKDVVQSLAPFCEEHQLQNLAAVLGSNRSRTTTQAPNPTSEKAVHSASRLSNRRRMLAVAGLGGASFLGYQLFGAKSTSVKPQGWRTLFPTDQPLVTLDRNAKYATLPKLNLISLTSNDATILPLGKPVFGRFQLETRIDNIQPNCAAGLAFRYAKEKLKIGTLHPFLSIQIVRNKDDTFRLLWKKYHWQLRRKDSEIEEQIWSTAELPSFRNGPIRLHLELGSRHLPVVHVNEEVIHEGKWSSSKQVQELRQLTQERLADYYVGAVGLFASGAKTEFRQTRLKYIL